MANEVTDREEIWGRGGLKQPDFNLVLRRTRPPLGIGKSAECLSHKRVPIFANLDLVASISFANRCDRLLLAVTNL